MRQPPRPSRWITRCVVVGAAGLVGCSAATAPAPEEPLELTATVIPTPTPPKEEITGNAASYFYAIQGDLAILDRRFGDAIQYLKLAVTADPRSVQLNDSLARLYVEAGRVEDALEHAEQASSPLDPDNTELRQLEARILFALDGDRATEAYRAILERDPDDNTALFQLALLRLRDNDLEEAHELLSSVSERDPESFQAHYVLGQIDTRRQRFDEAEEHYRIAQGLQPGSERILIELGLLYERWGPSGGCHRALRTHSRAQIPGQVQVPADA